MRGRERTNEKVREREREGGRERGVEYREAEDGEIRQTG